MFQNLDKQLKKLHAKRACMEVLLLGACSPLSVTGGSSVSRGSFDLPCWPSLAQRADFFDPENVGASFSGRFTIRYHFSGRHPMPAVIGWTAAGTPLSSLLPISRRLFRVGKPLGQQS